MKFLKENSVNLLICLGELILGILLLVGPESFAVGITIAFGVVCLIFGIVQIFFYWKKPIEQAISQLYLMKGLISVSIGLFCIIFSDRFGQSFQILLLIYGVILLICGFYKVQWSFDLLRQKQTRWFLGMIIAATTILFALLIIANRFSTMKSSWLFSGIFLIIQAIMDLVALLFARIFVNAKLPKFKKKEAATASQSATASQESAQTSDSEPPFSEK